jgi:hypothetical protein
LGSMADAEGTDRRGTYLSRAAADLQRREQLEADGLPITGSPEPAIPADSAFDLHPRVVLQEGTDQPFFLSRESPQRAIDSLARKSVVDIWGGPVIALVSLALLLRWLSLW